MTRTTAKPGTSLRQTSTPQVVDGRTIQSHVLLGDKARHRGVFFVRFTSTATVNALTTFVTTAEDVLENVDGGTPIEQVETGTLAFTQQGLEFLLGKKIAPSGGGSGGGAYSAGGPSVFARGAYRHALLVGDERHWLDDWAYGNQSKDVIHAAVVVARTTPEGVAEAKQAVAAIDGVEVVFVEAGSGGPTVKDAFGFVEGIQTICADVVLESGRAIPNHPDATVVDANHLLMGDPNFNDGEPIRFRRWAENASFFLVRRLLQNRTALEARAHESGGAERVMGRHRDGTSLFEDAAVPVPTSFLLDDAGGAVCPLDAHVRKMRSKDGSPYPIFRRAFRSDGDKSALIFCSFQSSIAFAFEELMRSALEGPADALLAGPSHSVVSNGGGYFVCLTTTGLASLL